VFPPFPWSTAATYKTTHPNKPTLETTHNSSADAIELQLPPDCGNGYTNAGVSLARLLWHVPIPAMMTLLASLLMERRVIVVGQSRDVVSAAVCAANALIYPFK